MVHLFTWLTLSLPPAAFAGEACREVPRPAQKADRVEDFYRLKRQREERDEKRERAASDVRGRGQAEAVRMEAARLEYVQRRRERPDDARAEAEWREHLRARAARNEDARECFVTQRDRAERGREIPADAEFGLDE